MKSYRIVFFSIISVFNLQSFAQCPDQILATVTSCGTVEASVNNFGGSGNIVWNWGDESETMLLNNVAHNYNNAGEYTICAQGSAPGCAEFLLCTDIVVASCADSCELDVEYVLMEDSILFYPFNYPANASIFWTVNGDEAGSGEQFAFNSETPGLYEICAIYETPECPSGVVWCYTMFVSDPDACPGEDDIVGINSDLNCAAWIFNIENFTDGSNVIWDFGDGTTTVSGDSIVDHLYTENGLYEVEITYVGQNCTSILIYELEVDCLEPNPCDLDMEVVYENDTLELYPYNFPEDAVLFWTLNEESIQTGDSLIMNLSEPGVYEICAAYETPACPNAVFWCETWAVQGEDDCPGEEDLFAGPSGDDCGDWVFEIGSFVPGTTVIWNFGDGNVEIGGHFTEHSFTENGEYEVWAVYNNLLCSDSISLGTAVVDCFTNCELDVEYVQDGDLVYFHAFNFPDDAVIFWTLDGGDGGQGDDFAIDVSEPGLYEICAMYETPECPQGVFWCYTWNTGGDDCPFELLVEEHEDCGWYTFALNNVQAGGYYQWNTGDTSYINFSGSQTLFLEPGFHEISVTIGASNYPACDNLPLTAQVEVPLCEPCPESLNIVEMFCGYFHFYGWGANDEIIYWQLIDGTDTLDWVTENGGGNSYNFTAPGEYSLCAEYFSADCPEGVTICEVLVVPDCNEPCQLEIVANDLGGGLFEFTAYGWPQDEELTWYPGDGTVLDGPWEMQNFYGPGNYEICAVMTNDSCSSVEDCVFIEVGEIECQWFEFAISSIIPDVPASFDWVIEDGDGNEAGSGSVELSGDTVTVLGEACVAAGCYTLTLNSDYPIGLESFDLDFPELPGNLIDINWIQGTNPFEMQAEISIGTECDWTIGVEESLLESVKIFPVPTDGELHIQLPADQLVELRFFNSVGKLVLTETVQYQKTISLRHLSAGMYVLQLQHDEKIKTFSIPLLN